MIEVKKLTKHYGNHVAVNNLSFKAKKGEILGLLGPNGAGKTTTMRIITGFMPPTSGSANVAGYDVLDESMEVRRRVGYLPERVPIYPDMSLKGYVSFWAKLHGVKNHQQKVDEVLDRFGLYDRRNNLVRSLSKGLRQRLGLAQALVHDPEVIVLDEPTIGIDPKQVIEVRDIVRDLRDNHTVLFSSHILSEVEQVCDRVLIINHGNVVAEGTPEMLSQRFKPGAHLYVAVRGDQDRVMDLLGGLPDVTDIQPKDDGFILSTDGDKDIRELVMRAMAENQLGLLEMRMVNVTLEDIFIDLMDERNA